MYDDFIKEKQYIGNVSSRTLEWLFMDVLAWTQFCGLNFQIAPTHQFGPCDPMVQHSRQTRHSLSGRSSRSPPAHAPQSTPHEQPLQPGQI